MNTTIYNSLDSSLKNEIASGRYYYGGTYTTSWIADYTSSNIYNYERNGSCPTGSCYINANIALLNISDYVYAAQSQHCSRSSSSCANNGTAVTNNWIGKMMYNSISTSANWIINTDGRYSSSYGGWLNEPVYLSGNTSYSSMTSSMNCAYSNYYVFPVFYLKNQGYATKGNGTSSNPYYFTL